MYTFFHNYEPFIRRIENKKKDFNQKKIRFNIKSEILKS